ncbi:MAG: SDR family oxidoreductase [Bacilli bacterium]|nr:SDR family oxidoreductase [Bacilli bacterium]
MKTVLITGGSQGLGESIAREFLKNNFNVLVAYNTGYERALKLEKELNVEIVKLDITNEEDVKNVFSNYKIDVLINNASVSMDCEIEYKTKEEFMRVLEVNLVGTFMMCKYGIINGVKDIINISSTDSIDTYSTLNIDYSASKAGLNIVTKTLALNYSDIRIVGVLPNWINTESVLGMNKDYLISELNRIGQSELLKKEDVAQRIYEIYSDKNIKNGELIRIG